MVLGAVAAVTVGLASAYASATGALPATDPIDFEVVSIDAAGGRLTVAENVVPAISDTGAVVAYDTIGAPVAVSEAGPALDARRVWVRDRVGGTSRPVAEPRSAAPGISGNGCVVAYSVFADSGANLAAPDATPTVTLTVTLTVVDRCSAPVDERVPVDERLPAGTPLGKFSIASADVAAPSIAAPALSFDGSTIVWSTGSEIRRYVRTASPPSYELDTFGDGTLESAGVVTGPQVDVSADGLTVVFVAGPRIASTNVYVWSAADPDPVPELISETSPEARGSYSSSSPTISSDGLFVVFESIRTDLSVIGASTVGKPFVTGADLSERTARMLVADATRPTLSADGNHVVYQRDDAIRVLSSGTNETTDVGIDELAEAGPTSGVAISQFGRWLLFAGAVDLDLAPADAELSEPAARAVWAVDRTSSIGDVVDTTTSTTTPPTTTTPTTTTPTTMPPTTPTAPSTTVPGVASQSPPITLVPAPVVTRFPTATTQFPTVGFPAPPPPPPSGRSVLPPSPSRGAGPSFVPGSGADLTTFASPTTFAPTVVDAGRRTQPVTLTNATDRAVQATTVSIDLPDVFVIVTDGCSGTSLAPSASCVVDVQFAPVTVGSALAVVVFGLSDGTVVTAALDGEGVPGPTLDVVPAVAGAGQTVTVFGVGFPAGSTVEFSQPGTSTAEPIVVDANGTFAHVVVVLPNTLTGPAVLGVRGQPGAFNDVVAELLVSSRGATSADAALRGALAGALGR